MMVGLKTGYKVIQEAEAEVKLEIHETKVKVLKGLHFHQELTKIETQEVKPRIIVKSMIKRKETFSKR